MALEQKTIPLQAGESQEFRTVVEELADQLCVVVDGEFDFTLRVDVNDETAEKLQMLINFVLDAARRRNSELQLTIKELQEEILQRERVEVALDYERYLLNTLMDHMPDSIYFKDLESRFSRVNKALADHVHLASPLDAVGKTDFDFFTTEHAQHAHEEEQEIINTSIPLVSVEEKECHLDGREAWMSTTKMPLPDRHGRIIGTFGISRNITDKKRTRLILEHSEAKFRSLVESSPDGIVMLNSAGKIELVNTKIEQMFAATREKLIGESIQSLIPMQLFKGGEYYGVTQDGREFPIDVSLSSLSPLEGSFEIITVRDVTARKLLQREFEVAREIQESLLPKNPPEIDGFDIASFFRPAASTGGDFYDYITFDHGNLGVVVGDVSGHGFGPAILTAATRSYLRATIKVNPDLSHVFKTTNQLICQDTYDGRFITAILLEIDTAKRTLNYVSAGHLDALLFDAAGNIKRLLSSTACPLGLFNDTIFPEGNAVQLEVGDMLLTLTDGFMETVSAKTELFGNARIIQSIKDHCKESSRQILDELYFDILQFRQQRPQTDDLTGVLIKVL